ncbi:hypothetical protein F503_07011 [Ophiostoma piceae UAMH 11346]|uniref:Uncharacterized protein n=1 Tax=Ophiostoma piceae (strain UAMH 11346) TaxID=1262450 RepID=S3D776_OPHP1|nr:hypothetical protein F503_07011 [Ophiostoma piceae UAMH 11346]
MIAFILLRCKSRSNKKSSKDDDKKGKDKDPGEYLEDLERYSNRYLSELPEDQMEQRVDWRVDWSQRRISTCPNLLGKKGSRSSPPAPVPYARPEDKGGVLPANHATQYQHNITGGIYLTTLIAQIKRFQATPARNDIAAETKRLEAEKERRTPSFAFALPEASALAFSDDEATELADRLVKLTTRPRKGVAKNVASWVAEARPLLDMNTLGRLAEYAELLANVKSSPAPTSAAINRMSSTVSQAPLTMAVPVSDDHEAVAAATNNADPDAIDKAEEQYVDISRVLNETSTTYESYDNALALTGFPHFTDNAAPSHNGNRGPVTFKPHQVIDAATLVRILYSPCRTVY